MKQEELCSALACQCPKSNPVNWIRCSAMDCQKWYHIHCVAYLEEDEKPEKWFCRKEKCAEHGSFRYLPFLHSSRKLHMYDEILCVTYMSKECRAGICPTTLPWHFIFSSNKEQYNNLAQMLMVFPVVEVRLYVFRRNREFIGHSL